jgi:hypothetical protein
MSENKNILKDNKQGPAVADATAKKRIHVVVGAEKETIENEVKDELEKKEKVTTDKKEREEEATKTSVAKGFGGLLKSGWIAKNIPFFLFLTFLAVLYIANGHYGDKTIRKINKVSKDLKELQYEYKTLKADVMFRSKESELVKAVAPLGLKTLEEPPVRIKVK